MSNIVLENMGFAQNYVTGMVVMSLIPTARPGQPKATFNSDSKPEQIT